MVFDSATLGTVFIADDFRILLYYLSAAKVQVTELAEPLFAAVLAWMFLNEIPEGRFFVGAILIIAGIVSINGLYRPLLKRVE